MMAWNGIAILNTESLSKRLTDWHEGRGAARMLIAALAAYLLTAAIHLPAPYTSVITTVIVARPHSDGVLRASLERVLATLLGAGLACLASFGRLAHIPELLLLTVTLAPLALVASHHSAYRTSLIAAMIVLSAPVVAGSPFRVAAIRMLGVTIGAVVGALVSVSVVPSRREVLVKRAATKLLKDLTRLLTNAIGLGRADTAKAAQGESAAEPADNAAKVGPDAARSNDYQLEFRVRQALREIALLVRDRPDGPPVRGQAAAIYGAIAHMHADITFLKRELQAHAPPQEAMSALGAVLGAFQGAADRVGAMGSAPSPNVDLQEFVQACERAAETLQTAGPETDGSALMLRRLGQDFSSLARAMKGATPRRATPNERGA